MSILERFGFSTSPSSLVNNIATRLDALAQSAASDAKVLSSQEDVASEQTGGLIKLAVTIDEKLSENLAKCKLMLYGGGTDSSKPLEVNPKHQKQIMAGLLDQRDLLARLLYNIGSLDFGGRRNLTKIFDNLLTKFPAETAAYFKTRPMVFKTLVSGYQVDDPNTGIVVNCDQMLRALLRSPDVAEEFLKDPNNVWPFFELVALPNFDVSGPAFVTFKQLFLDHKGIGARFVTANYDAFFKRFDTLLNSDNYLTKTESFEFLSDFLMIRTKMIYGLMIKYVSSPQNLMTAMQSLRVKSSSVQLAVFSLLKLFFVNPKKPTDVVTILLNNKEPLLGFVTSLRGPMRGEQEDPQFVRDKRDVIQSLEALQPTTPTQEAKVAVTTTTTTTTSDAAPKTTTNSSVAVPAPSPATGKVVKTTTTTTTTQAPTPTPPAAVVAAAVVVEPAAPSTTNTTVPDGNSAPAATTTTTIQTAPVEQQQQQQPVVATNAAATEAVTKTTETTDADGNTTITTITTTTRVVAVPEEGKQSNSSEATSTETTTTSITTTAKPVPTE